MNCKNAIKEISDYLDGELDPVVRQQLARHLSECKECTIIVSQTKATTPAQVIVGVEVSHGQNAAI